MKRKYQDIKLSAEIYCNSQGDLEFFGWCNCGHFGYQRGYFEIKGRREWLLKEMPAYFENEVRRQIVARARGEGFKVYEHDRDGNKRFTDLRYYDPERLAWAVNYYAKILGYEQEEER